MESDQHGLKQRWLSKVDQLIEKAEEVLATAATYDPGGIGFGAGMRFVDDALNRALRTSALSFLSRSFGESEPYYVELESITKGSEEYEAKQALSVLKALRLDIEADQFVTARQIVRAEIFSDYLEMASHLLGEGYKDAAAVIAGSSLEEHLRELCRISGIQTSETNKQGDLRHKKADRLNADLAKAGVYNAIRSKLVTGWLGIRNDAAHGKYDQYGDEQVNNMISGITEFIASTTS
jgi:hypothetical protein